MTNFWQRTIRNVSFICCCLLSSCVSPSVAGLFLLSRDERRDRALTQLMPDTRMPLQQQIPSPLERHSENDSMSKNLKINAFRSFRTKKEIMTNNGKLLRSRNPRRINLGDEVPAKSQNFLKERLRLLIHIPSIN